MNYKLIVAICNGNGIGNSNSIPWYSPMDLKHFSKLTKGISKSTDSLRNSIIMGRKTWESIPKKPLPKRFHIVLTSKPKGLIPDTDKYSNCVALSSIQEVEEFCKQHDFNENWVIGGGSIYEKYLNEKNITDIHLTHIHEDYNCDVFFPEVSDNFSIVSKEETMENNKKLEFLHYSKS